MTAPWNLVDGSSLDDAAYRLAIIETNEDAISIEKPRPGRPGSARPGSDPFTIWFGTQAGGEKEDQKTKGE